jgi:hypothetical protein
VSEQQNHPAAPDGQAPPHSPSPPSPALNFPPPQVYGAPTQPYGTVAAAPPYGAPTQPTQPYGAMPAAYGGYGQPGGYAPPPYGGYPQPASTPGASIALVVVSAFFVLMGLIGVPSLVIGIVALTRAKSDPEEASRLTWAGWLVLGILVALVVVIIVIALAVAASSSNSDDGSTIGALGTTVRPLVLRST